MHTSSTIFIYMYIYLRKIGFDVVSITGKYNN